MDLNLEKGKYADFSNFSELHGKLADEGYQVFTWQDSSGDSHMNHSHPNDELIVISSGKIVFTINELRFEMEPGDALSLPANTVHSAVNEERQPVCYFICTKKAS